MYLDPLEALLKSALLEKSKRRVTAGKLPEHTTFNTLYTDQANWSASRGVALIHRADNGALTLLGNFTEFTHNRTKGVRKLVRAEGVISIDSQEVVTGQWWLTKEVAHRISPSEEVQDIELSLDVVLHKFGVHCHGAKLFIRLLHNAFFRVELAEQTRFVDPANNQFIFFPAGLDILDGLSYETKVALRQKLDSQA